MSPALVYQTLSERLGYEKEREKMRLWLDRYVLFEFGLKPCALLDYGCGDGFWTQLFVEAEFDAIGCDSNVTEVEAGRLKYPELRLDVVALAALPYANGAFPVVYARCLVNHAVSPSGLGVAIPAIRALLSKVAGDGQLILATQVNPAGLVYGDPYHSPPSAVVRLAEAAGGRPDRLALHGAFLMLGVRP